jgi:hypothetical protein
VPIGFWLMSAALPFEQLGGVLGGLDRGEAHGHVLDERGVDFFQGELDVWSSTLSILVMLVSIPMSVKYGNSVG